MSETGLAGGLPVKSAPPALRAKRKSDNLRRQLQRPPAASWKLPGGATVVSSYASGAMRTILRFSTAGACEARTGRTRARRSEGKPTVAGGQLQDPLSALTTSSCSSQVSLEIEASDLRDNCHLHTPPCKKLGDPVLLQTLRAAVPGSTPTRRSTSLAHLLDRRTGFER